MKDVWALREEGNVKVVLTDDMTISRHRSPGVRPQPSVWHVFSFSNSGPGIGDTTVPAHEGGQNNLKVDATPAIAALPLAQASIAPPHFTYRASSNPTCRNPADLLHTQLIRPGFIVRSLCAAAYSRPNDPDLPSLYRDTLVGWCARSARKNLVGEWVAWNPSFLGYA